MVIVRLMGGLGNQLFQYAAGKGVSRLHNVSLKLDLSYYVDYKNTKWARRYGLNHFNIDSSAASEEEIVDAKKQGHFKETHFHYHPEIRQVGPNIYLEGYWQSERYFQEVWSELQHEFVFIDKPSEANRQMAKKIQRCESVALHIRRGDYVSDRHVREILKVCSLAYYDRAIQFLRKHVGKAHFFIFSDDPGWVQKWLRVKNPSTLVQINNEISCHEDMRLMSLCKHHIIANSTFSWWGAWLSNNTGKLVVAPKDWLRVKSKDWNPKDLIPKTWHRL